MMKYIIRATTAAPGYFEPFKLLNMADHKTYHFLIDGGVVANNPAMCAFTEATTLKRSDILMVSLGTGSEKVSYQGAVNWGLALWLRPLFRLMIKGSNDMVDYQLNEIFSAKPGSHYYRFQVKLPEENIGFDNTTEENIMVLEKSAQDLIVKENNNIDKICHQLVS